MFTSFTGETYQRFLVKYIIDDLYIFTLIFTHDNYRLIHALFHIRTVIIPRDRKTDIGQRALTRGSISVEGWLTVLKWKKAWINLFITYFNIEIKRTKLTFTQTPNLYGYEWSISVEEWQVLIWKKSCINLFIERLDIVLSDFCPDICPWADIAVAFPVFMYGQNWSYYYNNFIVI